MEGAISFDNGEAVTSPDTQDETGLADTGKGQIKLDLPSRRFVSPDGKARADKLVCMDAGAVVKDGLELFDAEGTPTKVWREHEKLLQEYENDATKTAGMYRIDEAALTKLSAYQFRKLIEQGWMEKIYAHIISLRNFQTLLDHA